MILERDIRNQRLPADILERDIRNQWLPADVVVCTLYMTLRMCLYIVQVMEWHARKKGNQQEGNLIVSIYSLSVGTTNHRKGCTTIWIKLYLFHMNDAQLYTHGKAQKILS